MEVTMYWDAAQSDDRNSCQPCSTTCPAVFDRVIVSHVIRGGSTIMWELLQTFIDPGPLVFQLQVASISGADTDAWENVGLPVENQYCAIDPEQRVWGKTQYTHYRVKLTTPLGTYYSAPVFGLGVLDRRGWRHAREIIRQNRLAFRVGPGGQEGYLLKRRWTGQRCPVCTDLQTNEPRDAYCPTCYGTGFRCGYYYPMSCIWAELSPARRHIELDAGQARGTINDVIVQARMIAIDLMSEDDIWVSDKTDDRYYIHSVQNIAEIRGVPLLAQVEMRPIAYTSPVYTIEIPRDFQSIHCV